ncbi:MAG TPA: hypothetical protein VLM75_05020 [Spirochaetota bacterium]|nr:hypothetical protein [Spirochaetota bacterium]
MQGNSRTGIVMATMIEAGPLIASLGLSAAAKGPVRVFSADGAPVLAVSGIGKVNAALAAEYLILNYGVGTIFNIGAAGATGNAMHTGDIFHIDSIIEPDRPRIMNRSQRSSTPDAFDGFRKAILATLDRPLITASERASVAARADLIDMEGAAVLQACRLFKVRCYLFKMVSDTPEHESDTQIVENIRLLAAALAGFFIEKVLPLSA